MGGGEEQFAMWAGEILSVAVCSGTRCFVAKRKDPAHGKDSRLFSDNHRVVQEIAASKAGMDVKTARKLTYWDPWHKDPEKAIHMASGMVHATPAWLRHID
jgi:hypothetical protein